MIVIYGTVVILYIVLFFLSAKSGENTFYTNRKPFEKMSGYIYRKLYKRNFFRQKQAESDLEMLSPGISAKEKTKRSHVEKYYVHKISLVLLMIFIGNVFAAALCLSSLSSGILADGKYISRNTYGLGSTETGLRAEIEDNGKKTSESFTLTVEERKYEKAVIKVLAAEAAGLLPELMLGDNRSPEEIQSSLNLIQEIEGYPFHISWESDNYALIYSDGTVINEEVSKMGEVVNLTAVLTYDDYKEEHIFAVCICPPVYSGEELLKKKISEALRSSEESSRQEEQLTLPETVEEVSIGWKEEKEDDSIYIFLLICIGAAGVYLISDKELHEKAELRNRQMLMDYPKVVSKLTLYMGAGMTIRNAFRKIADDYKKEKEKKYCYVYEEMLLTCYELDSGISETAAYESFGKRCRLPQYMKLSNILIQNLKKGSNGILAALGQEAAAAFEERKNTARKLGEEAGTKLLFPMIIMLGIVMVLIIVPAYFSFSA